MTPGAIVELTSGQWIGRIGVVEVSDPERPGAGSGVVVRLRSGIGRPAVERVIVGADELRVVQGEGAA